MTESRLPIGCLDLFKLFRFNSPVSDSPALPNRSIDYTLMEEAAAVKPSG